MSNNFYPIKHKFSERIHCNYCTEMNMPWITDKQTGGSVEYIRADLAIPRADVMELVKSAEAVLNRWDQPSWKDVKPTADFMNAMRNTLANFNQKYGQLTKSPENVTCADLTNAADSSQNIEHTGE